MIKLNKKEIENLKKIFLVSKYGGVYRTREDFQEEFLIVCNQFINQLEKFQNRKYKESIVLSIQVSKSGMSREFNFANTSYNLIFNIIYNNKISYEKVKVGGCGMDMLWYLLHTTAQTITKRKDYNATCSYITKTI